MLKKLFGFGRQPPPSAPKPNTLPVDQIAKALNQQPLRSSPHQPFLKAQKIYVQSYKKMNQQENKKTLESLKTYLVNQCSTDFVLSFYRKFTHPDTDSEDEYFKLFSVDFAKDVLYQKAVKILQYIRNYEQNKPMYDEQNMKEINKILDELVSENNIKVAKKISKINSETTSVCLYKIGLLLIKHQAMEQAKRIKQQMADPYKRMLEQSIQKKQKQALKHGQQEQEDDWNP